jgi:2-polyprenyl-3-methyl-5-hydroxy-6-metoxy-1,4-benzoquinol methylase
MKLKYTGERIIPDQMTVDPVNLQLHLNRYIFVLPYTVNNTCLDVACGTGYGMQLISMTAKSITGIDNDKKSIEWAKLNHNFYNKKVNFIKLDLNEDKIKGEFDVIISFETIEHLNSPEEFLKKLKSNLKKNGLLIFSTPISEPPNPFHKHFFDWKSINELVAKVFSKNIKWYSQSINSIEPGQNKYALCAICVISNSSTFHNIKKNSIKLLKKGKIKFLEMVKIIPRSRW